MFVHLAVATITTALGASAAPEYSTTPRYYFVLFGGQSIPFRAYTAHTWATYVKATPTAGGQMSIEQVTISWLPAQGDVRPLRIRAVEGKNYSLDETFAKMLHNESRVSAWGPFETDATRYELAAQQAATLSSGAVKFRSVDSFRNNRSVQHCANAVVNADPNLQRLIQPVLQVGEPGTSKLAAKYVSSGAVVGSGTHDWVLTAIGADRYPLVRRAPGERIPRQFR